MAYLKKLLLLKLLVTLTLCGKQSERYYQEKFAREIGGQVEVVMKDGTRCDILTATHAIVGVKKRLPNTDQMRSFLNQGKILNLIKIPKAMVS